MAQGAGSECLMGLRQESTFGTAVDCNATGFGFRALDWSWEDNRAHVPDMSLNGSPVDRESGLLGPYSGSLSYTVDLKYQGLGRHLGLALGTSGAPATVNTSYYGHTQVIRNIMTGRHATIAFYDGTNYQQFVGMRCTSLELEGGFGEECVKAKFTWQPRFRQVNTAPNTSFSSMTEPTPIDRVQPIGGTISYKICAQGGTLTAVEIKSWKLKFAFPFPYEYSSTGQHLCRETRRGKVVVTGSLEFPAYETAFETYLAAPLTINTLYALELNHILSANIKEWGVWIPSLKIVKVSASPKDKGQIPMSADFIAEYATTSTTGAAVSAMPYFYGVNSDSATLVA